jgi:hypothetical protein
LDRVANEFAYNDDDYDVATSPTDDGEYTDPNDACLKYPPRTSGDPIYEPFR